MITSYYFNRFSVIVLLLILPACAGGGGGSSSETQTAPNISLSASSLNFMGVVQGNSKDRTLTITNTGDENLSIGDISISAVPFSVSYDACSDTTLAPSDNCVMGIRFSPTSQGTFSAELSVSSNDPGSDTEDIRLNGIGYGLNTWINSVDCSNCPDISLNVTVTNPETPGMVLELLTEANFSLYHDDVLQDITATALVNPSPVSLVLALDWSNSTSSVRSDIQNAAISFVNLLADGDEAAICKFNENREFYPTAEPYFIASDAAGKAALNDYIDNAFAGAATSLYDTVIACVERAREGANTKQTIIILSDGVDNASGDTLNQAINYAKLYGIPVFAIYFYDAAYEGGVYGNPETMQRLAGQTDGQYYTADSAVLEDIFAWIANTLSNTYTIEYASPACTGTASLEIRADQDTLHGITSRTITLPD